MTRQTATGITEVGGECPTNGALETISVSKPYIVTVKLQGVCDMLFHRYNCESVASKGAAAKGSKAKKTDDLESYVYRDEKSNLCIPGEYLRQAIIHAAKFRQDPRSPRKSAMDIFKAACVSLTQLAPIFSGERLAEDSRAEDRSGRACRGMALKTWSYEDSRRVVIQRSAVTRTRPAIKSGWEAEFQVMVNLPEYIRPNDLHDVITNAGKLIGLGDFRPSYGRFVIVTFDVGLE